VFSDPQFVGAVPRIQKNYLASEARMLFSAAFKMCLSVVKTKADNNNSVMVHT
jgi:hypothetical protein